MCTVTCHKEWQQYYNLYIGIYQPVLHTEKIFESSKLLVLKSIKLEKSKNNDRNVQKEKKARRIENEPVKSKKP